MKLTDLIADLTRLSSEMGPDADVVLYDRADDHELIVDADADRYDFEVLRGENQVVVEFDRR